MKSLFYSLSCTGILLVACTNDEKQHLALESQPVEQFVSAIQPIKGLETPVRTFKIDAADAATIDLPNGGSIIFPANAFVDANGKIINGEVKVEWQEFHSLTDIMLSGIPMKYDSAGVEHDFVSGGMFTIDATHQGEKVDLAEGKTATVNLASYSDTECFNFYELDEKTGDWKYETTKVGTPLESSEKKVEPKNTNNSILDVTVDLVDFPELKSKQIVGWKTTEPVSAELRTKLKTHPSDVELQKRGNNYALLIQRKGFEKSIEVTPHLLSDALADKNNLMLEAKEKYSELLAYQQNAESGKLVRTIEIPSMGTFNWDKVLKRKKQQQLLATFNLNKEVNADFVTLFFLSPDENVAIQCNANGTPGFNFDPTLPNYLVAILPDNSILMVDDKGFDKARNANSGERHTFHFQDVNKKVATPQELADLLQGLMQTKS